MTGVGGPTPEPGDHLLNLLGGKHRAQALSTAASLGIADRLAEAGPRSSGELAEDLGCDPADLRSLLQLLTGLGYFAEQEPDRYVLTPHGETLRRDALGPLAEFVGSAEQWDPWARLRESIRDPSRRTAYELTTGKKLYDSLAGDPAAAARYDAAIDAFTRHEAAALRARLDLGTASRLVDVGGGRGTLLVELLAQWPDLRGVLLDLPHVVRAAEAVRSEAGLAGRLELVAGDFFVEVPSGADVYLLKHVLHNWDDDEARALLERCADAVTPSGRVVAIDAVLAPDSRPDLARLLDLEMRVLTGGRQRRKPELRRLFASAGLALERVEQLTAASWMLVARRK